MIHIWLINHKTFLGKEFLIAKTTSRVTHATQEDKIIQKERTLNPIPTRHNQTSYINQVQIEYQDHKIKSTKDIHLKSGTTCQKYIIT